LRNAAPLPIAATLPEDHWPFWNQKLKQNAVAVARQERKVATAPPEQARPYRKYLYLLRMDLDAQYAVPWTIVAAWTQVCD
jgi:hypothetical protein